MLQESLQRILETASAQVRALFGDRLISAILYGSYARGDFDEESDIDIALLVDCSREEIHRYFGELASITTDISLDYGKLISFICIPNADYRKWLPTLPFYQNIQREGVLLNV